MDIKVNNTTSFQYPQYNGDYSTRQQMLQFAKEIKTLHIIYVAEQIPAQRIISMTLLTAKVEQMKTDLIKAVIIKSFCITTSL